MSSVRPSPPGVRLARIASPLRWSPVDKCLAIAGVTLPFRVSNLLLTMRVRANPASYAYTDARWVSVYERLLVVVVALWVATLATGVALRKRAPEQPVFVHWTLQLFWLSNGVLSYGLGVLHGPFWVSTLGAALLAMVLFGPRRAYAGIASAGLLIAVLTALERARVIPFAPLLRETPLDPDGRPLGAWMAYMMGTSVAVTAVVIAAGHYMFTQWREYERRLEVLSRTDALTELTNRGHFMERCERELNRSRRHNLPLAMLLIDIDHFKSINDQHGHQAGDAALRVVARALAGAVRKEDLVARYGGEEFAVLLPHTTAQDALTVAERCRAAVGDAAIALESGATVRLSVTVGVAGAPPGAPHTVDDLVRVADAALYEGKTQGRDRVVVGASA